MPEMAVKSAKTQKGETEKKNPAPSKTRQDLSQSIETPIKHILYLQRTIGNRAVTHLLQSGALQAKVKIGAPNDIYEKEADRVADSVMKMPGGSLVQRESSCSGCMERGEEPIVQQSPKPLAQFVVQRQEALIQVLNVGPIDALRARRNAQTALRDARATGLPGPHNGPQDAWRHCYWNCLMVNSIGVEQARMVADTHEDLGANPPNERAMDLHNNEVGRNCGVNSDCQQCSTNNLNRGLLWIIPDWGGNARGRPISSNSVRGSTNYPNVHLVRDPVKWNTTRIARLPKGTIVRVLQRGSTWMRVVVSSGSHGGQEGWIMNKFFTRE